MTDNSDRTGADVDGQSLSLTGRRVVLGVCGGIAAYKAVILCRMLMDAGAHVMPVMTAAAQRFVGRATFDALASERVRTSVFNEDDPIPHTTLGQSADVIVVAPATARLIGSYAAGISDGLLTATLLATRAPVVVCPAMHTEMWEHEAVQRNLAVLTDRGVNIVAPQAGQLAGGDIGTGRLAEPETILDAITAVLNTQPELPDRVTRRDCAGVRDFAGVSVTVTAGGTREPIDPVRFIGNRSSGKQGYAIAAAARDRGAEVTLITSAALPLPDGVQEVRVSSAADMEAAVSAHTDVDVIVMAAAVADFRPVNVAPQKIKKDETVQGGDGERGAVPVIELERTADILAKLGAAKPAGQVLVGFAAETSDVLENASQKLSRKNLDVMVANDVSAAGAGFGQDTNIVTILLADGSVRPLPICSKRQVAEEVLDAVANLRNAQVRG